MDGIGVKNAVVDWEDDAASSSSADRADDDRGLGSSIIRLLLLVGDSRRQQICKLYARISWKFCFLNFAVQLPGITVKGGKGNQIFTLYHNLKQSPPRRSRANLNII